MELQKVFDSLNVKVMSWGSCVSRDPKGYGGAGVAIKPFFRKTPGGGFVLSNIREEIVGQIGNIPSDTPGNIGNGEENTGEINNANESNSGENTGSIGGNVSYGGN